MKTGLYKITAPNGKFYIGSTTQTFKKRWNAHRSNLRRGCHRNKILQRAWNKYGEENMTFSILLYCAPELCEFYEQLALEKLPHSYNLSMNVVAPMLGRKHAEASKEKCRKSQYERFKNPTESMKKQKKCGWPLGKPHKFTDAHCKSISESAKKREAERKRTGIGIPNARKVRCIETGEIFQAVQAAIDWIRETKNPKASRSISSCCTGNLKSAYGYHWQYVDEVAVK